MKYNKDLIRKLRPLILFIRHLESKVPPEKAKFWHGEGEIGEMGIVKFDTEYRDMLESLLKLGTSNVFEWIVLAIEPLHLQWGKGQMSFWQFRESFLLLINQCVTQYAKNPLVRPAFLQEGANDLDIWKEFSELQSNYQMGKFDYLLNAMQMRAAMQCPKCLKEVINTKIEMAKRKEAKSEQEIMAIELAAIPIIVATFHNCM